MLEELRSEELRSLMLEALRKKASGSISELHMVMAEMALARRPQPASHTPNRPGVYMPFRGDESLTHEDRWRANDVFWDLMIEGVVRPGFNALNQDLPWYHLTEMGREAVKGLGASPHDPEGYLRQLKADVPELDAVIFTYLTECLHTFRIGCLLSAAVTLGCASEKALLLLVDSCTAALPAGPQREGFAKKTGGKMIAVQHEEFLKMFNGHFRALVKKGETGEHLDTAVDFLFTLFRDQRNDAGHPSGATIRREAVYAHITAFPFYLSEVYGLIRWFKARAVP